ncbi:hypothetical protein SAMN03159338_0714 [Sphingomonas sp. NFR04]|uniref:retropepsin-like aspartic protease n=1 Tax=Sphingomonas sp. NFR04 TaxID=1566283 RepID=UPI0008EC9C40|nr:hypothetical protein [Sphingomonas sp. NFR04]SFJ06933.1 hypothetical protein SAMN03159338_0714 [Sphingomonas sp. NFR04]
MHDRFPGTFRLVLDTGGTIGLIRLELARQLQLKQLGTARLNLLQGHKQYPIFVVPDLTFANQVRQPVSTIAGVDNVRFLDGAVGSIAAGALTAGNCELDFDAGEWRIYRDGPPDRTGWARYPDGIFKYGNANGSAFLAADATLGGRPFRFGLDTGMPSRMRVYRKAAEAAGLWDAPRWAPTAPEGKGRLVRTSLRLANATVEDVLVTLVNEPDWGAFPNGVIGLPVLRLFNIATNASEKTVFLKRNARAPEPQSYNRAGLWIDRAGSAVTIGVVGAGSPAVKAGLAAGDRLIGADFDSLLRQFSDAAGTEIMLNVERAGVRREVRLVLEDFL